MIYEWCFAMMDKNKLKVSFEIEFDDDNTSDTLKKMVIATIKHDITNVLENHVDLVNGFKYSDIEISGD